MVNKTGRSGIQKALIKSKWYIVQQINTTTQKAIVTDGKGKDHLVNLRDVDVWLEDVSTNGKSFSATVKKRK